MRRSAMVALTAWTVQPLGVYYQLHCDGEVRAWPREKYLEWLVPQLSRRVPGYAGGCPWWLYCVKPELRWLRRHRPAGQWQVRLELELDERRVCRFPIWAWHKIYCGQYLGRSAREGQQFRARLRRAHGEARRLGAGPQPLRTGLGQGPLVDLHPLPSPWREELEHSWETLFDSDLMRRRRPGAPREAVVESIRLEDVRRAVLFRGQSAWR